MSEFNKIPADLDKCIAGRGHADYPCLSPGYSPVSRVPCTDFTDWIIANIKYSRPEPVVELVCNIVAANPGIGSSRHDGLLDHWRKQTNAILSIPLTAHLKLDSYDAELELRAGLVMWQLHNLPFSGFSLIDSGPKYLASCMVPNSIRFTSLSVLASKANTFINRMREKVPSWQQVPTINMDQDEFDEAAEHDCKKLIALLKQLPMNTRSHYFDTIACRCEESRAISRPLIDTASYDTKK